MATDSGLAANLAAGVAGRIAFRQSLRPRAESIWHAGLSRALRNRATLAHSMPKWFAIRASAVIAILGGLAALLFAATLAIATLLTQARDTGPLAPGVMKLGGVAVAALLAAGAVWSITAGIAIFRRRSWARVSITMFAGLLALLGVTGALAMVALPFAASPEIDQRMAAAVRVSMLGVYGVFAALGAGWLILFTRRAAAQYFAAQAPAPGGPPLSIAFVAWYLLASAALTALAPTLRFPAALFGLVLNGWGTALFYALCTAAQIYLGSGLLNRGNTARIWSIVFFAALAASGAAFAFRPDFREQALEFNLLLQGYSRMEIPDTGLWWLLAAWCLLTAGVPISLLVWQRAAFRPPAAPAGPAEPPSD
jgi:hypothetical protein